MKLFNRSSKSKARIDFTAGIEAAATADYNRRFALRSLAEMSDESTVLEAMRTFLENPLSTSSANFRKVYSMADASEKYLRIAGQHSERMLDTDLASLYDLAQKVATELEETIKAACAKAIEKAQALADEDGIAADTSSIASSYAREIENLPLQYGDARRQYVNALAQRLGLEVTKPL